MFPWFRPAPPGFTMITPANPAERKQSLAGLRLRKHADYQRAYTAAGRKRQSASMSWFMTPPSESESPCRPARVGLTAGRILGKAHERNRIKRRMRDVLRRHVDLLHPGVDLIFHPRRTVLALEFGKLEGEVVRILTQARAEAQRAARSASPRDQGRSTRLSEPTE
ncbi:MAG TPA: ribonuclease P protein component [Terracidiphilus sp.]